jgi:hypothetical protein
MKSSVHRLLVTVLIVIPIGCATVPPPEVEAITLDVPTYLEDTLRVTYRPDRKLQFGNMSCLLDEKLTPLKSELDVVFACNEFRVSGVNVTLGWGRTGNIRGEVEDVVARNMRIRSRLGPAEESIKDVKVCTEEKVETIKDKGVLVRCRVEFFTRKAEYKRATFSVFYLNPQQEISFQPFVITEGSFGRGDEDAQRDIILYAEALDWSEK